jgi:hypothetical protein
MKVWSIYDSQLVNFPSFLPTNIDARTTYHQVDIHKSPSYLDPYLYWVENPEWKDLYILPLELPLESMGW